MGGSSLYDHPELYAALLAPEPDLLDDLDLWVAEHLRGRIRSVMDPACGPGTFLVPYARSGCRVAGNDIRPEMIASARRRLGRTRVELTCGDMRELHFESGPFDLALNLSSSVGHLRRDADLERHLASVAEHLRPGGLYFLGLTILDREVEDDDLWVLFEGDPMRLPEGGMGAVRYESLQRHGRLRRERIRVITLTNGAPELPRVIMEEYTLRTFPPEVVRRLLERVAVFDLLAVHDMTHPRRAAVRLEEALDATLILRRR